MENSKVCQRTHLYGDEFDGWYTFSQNTGMGADATAKKFLKNAMIKHEKGSNPTICLIEHRGERIHVKVYVSAEINNEARTIWWCEFDIHSVPEHIENLLDADVKDAHLQPHTLRWHVAYEYKLNEEDLWLAHVSELVWPH